MLEKGGFLMLSKHQLAIEVELIHGDCADVLMLDYGIPTELRIEVCEHIAKIWAQNTMVHCLIIASIRGWQPQTSTRSLENFLREHQSHPPKNHRPK